MKGLKQRWDKRKSGSLWKLKREDLSADRKPLEMNIPKLTQQTLPEATARPHPPPEDRPWVKMQNQMYWAPSHKSHPG